MTTLPQTTTPRLPQGPGPTPPNPFASQIHAGGAAGGVQMTPADVWRVIRGSIWWIILLTLLGGGAAWGLEWYLERNAPKYTATGILQILPPPNIDPVRAGGDTELAPLSLVNEQRTQQNLLLTEFTFSSLLQNPVVRDTQWFKDYAGDPKTPNNTRKAKEYLKENIAVTPITDSALLRVSFTYSKPADCKTVVDELVRIHLEQQREVARGRLDSRTRMLRELRSNLSSQLKSVSDRVVNQQATLTTRGMNSPGTASDKQHERDMLVEAQLRANTAASAAKNMYERVFSLVNKGESLPEVEKAIENDVSVAGFVRDVSALKIQRDITTDTYGKDHTNVKRLDRLIDLTQAQLDARRQELRVKYTNQVVETLKGQSAETETDLVTITKRLEALRSELADLNKEADVLRKGLDEEKDLREQRTFVENRLREIDSSASPENQMRINWAPGGQPEVPDVPTFPLLVVFLP
ncbi:MAG: hypothetical protein ABSH20_06750, partial [Tepidisphaeraceae bacterium]